MFGAGGAGRHDPRKAYAAGHAAIISFRTNCAYAIGGSTGRRIPSGANCTITLSGGGLTLTVNGAQAAAGVSLELRRGSSGGANGATFTSPSYSGVYPGDLLFSVSSGSIQTVLRAYIEDYVVGVVACEMGAFFFPRKR